MEGNPMSHIPVNHHLRPLYRVLAGLAAVYVIIFGVAGVVRTSDLSFFARAETSVLGLRTNLAFSVASVVVGVLILLALFVGRNVDKAVNLWFGIVFMAVGVGTLAVLHTDLNKLNFSLATVIVSFVIGMVLF